MHLSEHEPKSLLVIMLSFLFLLAPAELYAKSWCAYPVRAHEWGVQVFGEAPDAPAPLSFAYTSADASIPPPPVRDLPVDSGMRALPVISFFAPNLRLDEIPLGIEVGFLQGEAALWFPQVDQLIPAHEAQSAAAQEARATLLEQRAERQAYEENTPLDADPTRQLIWESLSLSKEGEASVDSRQPWVKALRALEGALWLTRESERDRFVFYEGRTEESPLLSVERGEEWSETRPHYVLKNDSSWPVQDVLVIKRSGENAWVFFAPSIPAGKSAGFVFEDKMEVASEAYQEATRGQLARSLVDASSPTPPTEYDWSTGTCVMGRDPAIPVESAEGHRLYQAEVDLLLDAWGPAFFEHEGTVVIYREDTTYLDHMMPLSIYTNMYHFIELRRAGLVLWTDAPW